MLPIFWQNKKNDNVKNCFNESPISEENVYKRFLQPSGT